MTKSMSYIGRLASNIRIFWLSNRAILKIFIFILSIFYCYLSPRPKHGDFWGLYHIAENVAQGNLDVYQIMAANSPEWTKFMHPPAFFLIQGAWIKFGKYIYNYLNTWIDIGSFSHFYQFWGMITYLFALFVFVTLAYLTLKNKWLCLICYGTFTFVSVIIMGQTDIFCALFMYLSLISALKSFDYKNKKSTFFIIISIITLGISMTFKFYGGLLFPIYILFFYLVYKLRLNSAYELCGIMIFLILTFLLSFMFIWIPYFKWFGLLVLEGSSSWLWNLQIAPVGMLPYHNISIWLLGYSLILYDLMHNIINRPRELYADKKYFIFYAFASVAWFFVGVFTHPQWWMIIVPPMLLALDNFDNELNYLFTFSVLALFWFYPMMWVNNIDVFMRYYVPVVPIEGNLTTILVTLMVSVLIMWIIELKKELT